MQDTKGKSKPISFRASQEVTKILEKIQSKIESELGASIAQSKIIEITIREYAKARGIK